MTRPPQKAARRGNIKGKEASELFLAAGESNLISRAERISRSLRNRSREIRQAKTSWKLWASDSLRLGSPFSFSGAVISAFVSIVLVPTICVGLYLAVWLSDQYASETRFAVRSAEGVSNVLIAGLIGAGSRAQDSLVVADYIRGRDMVEKLEAKLDLRTMFSRDTVDILSRFDTRKPVEKLQRYWNEKVDVGYDSMSGIVTVIVRAFTPQDALLLTQAVLSESERLVNDMSSRARRDALSQAQEELNKAERSLEQKSSALRELRNQEGILDAEKTSEALIRLITSLRLELARIESEYAAQRSAVAADSPQLRIMDSRIRATKDQIRAVEARMTASTMAEFQNSGNAALSEKMLRFDKLKLEQEYAQKRYVEAASAFERARFDLEAQQLYLTVFVQPRLAQDSLYPKRWWIFSAAAAVLLAVWAILVSCAWATRYYRGWR